MLIYRSGRFLPEHEFRRGRNKSRTIYKQWERLQLLMDINFVEPGRGETSRPRVLPDRREFIPLFSFGTRKLQELTVIYERCKDTMVNNL